MQLTPKPRVLSDMLITTVGRYLSESRSVMHLHTFNVHHTHIYTAHPSLHTVCSIVPRYSILCILHTMQAKTPVKQASKRECQATPSPTYTYIYYLHNVWTYILYMSTPMPVEGRCYKHPQPCPSSRANQQVEISG